MPDDQITDANDLLKRVSDFGENLKERRRFERKKLLWAATLEMRGKLRRHDRRPLARRRASISMLRSLPATSLAWS